MGRFKILAACAALVVMGACGDTTGKQAIYGAAGGLLAAEVLGADRGAGVILGTAANVLACDSGTVNCK